MNGAAHRSRGPSSGNPAPTNPTTNPENPSPPHPVSELQNAIRRRAEEIYERGGRIQGRDLENWMQAEAEVQSHAQSAIARKAAIVVKVEGVSYVGEYDSASADGYIPGEFEIGGPVSVRLHGDWMYVMRPNGKELQTRVIERMS
jgi:hypothetical protein